ncbi:MAG TPA: PIN domain-containing protein [Chitinivibrionales bacterium]|jgi:hypothetical protein|nr:PIN domain-containing protein [Chitinivibrionales bacterium]
MDVYCDTSVIGGCFDEEFAEWSNELMEEIRRAEKTLVLSDLTLEELARAPDRVRGVIDTIPRSAIRFVALNESADILARAYISEGIVSSDWYIDCRHIALATVEKVDVLVSWNFKHIVNYNRIRLYNSVNLKHGFPMIEIRSPREVISNEKSI